ncbi:site-specific DNA-methyltransferase [Pseudoalteromonas sp. OFAV1]|uniref:DNA-methyltransferase n=1 Tax=Pseudoalteromonas sp. OFAV1 TaxID=2908892 RepID=UPI001F3DC6D5|nr:site-specific DNA-methyltransferase [Pseudoalteromonas sp. OFAV1]MCF2901553.1 site-specific DNA-methyltransferase [Pseudoalteromonas sp. OFAV1]
MKRNNVPSGGLVSLIDTFFEIIETPKVQFSKKLLESAEDFLNKLSASQEPKRARSAAIRAIKRKLKLEDSNFKEIVNSAATYKVYFNTVEKKEIYEALCNNNLLQLERLLDSKTLSSNDKDHILSQIKLISDNKVLEEFHNQVDSPLNRRTKEVDSSLKETMLEAIFSNFIYELFDEKHIHCLNSGIDESEYEFDYWDYINSNDNFSRTKSLQYIFLNEEKYSQLDYSCIRELVCQFISESFDAIDNHGYLAIHIHKSQSHLWELASDIVLFAEKFYEHKEEINYFKPEKIEKITSDYLDIIFDEGSFTKINEGFFYKDTFCLYSDDGETAPDLLILFRKDVRDETKIPCPKCRSKQVQGNSYPRLGVKSWECKNLICADRSMSNRGKRFSYESILKQQAIDCPDSQISKSILSRWKRDILYSVNKSEIYEYLIKCYSLPGDGITFFNAKPVNDFGRTISTNSHVTGKLDLGCWENFISSDFFKRWNFDRKSCMSSELVAHELSNQVHLLQGDSEFTLKSLASDSISGAVTSPPYYNAREYSQYPNLYCYLHKMRMISSEVFRTLEPGSVFVFNIFDYFDNENIIISSAMGKKRMILSSLIVHSFRTLGFEYITNIPWDKGEIEGNRAYNSGNLTPYYQSPLNCWEHNLIFKKPGKRTYEWPFVLRCKPVIKMVKGKNTYGHTAPFPESIPNLLMKNLKPGELVLDPFAGSGTTAISAKKHGIRCILSEAMDEYVELIKKKLN